jgi:ADP-dependent NAD(P)H-hydrate dehydratase / NAD(P)H-hydrate epimerase
MKRSPTSHKGQNGVVAVIGGSRTMHGAPIFSALAAEASGVDLLYPCVPECHTEVTKAASYNFFVTPFRGNHIDTGDVSVLEDVLKNCNAAVIGPGLATFDTAQDAVKELIAHAQIPLVVDAGALQPWTFDALQGKTAVVTPHVRELSRMQGQVLEKKSLDELQDIICTIAKARKITVLLKGTLDLVGGVEGVCHRVKGGNAGLTKGGTGDALAGLIAGLMAQKVQPFEACVMAATIIKRAAETLEPTKGYGFTTMEVIEMIPELLHVYEG